MKHRLRFVVLAGAMSGLLVGCAASPKARAERLIHGKTASIGGPSAIEERLPGGHTRIRDNVQCTPIPNSICNTFYVMGRDEFYVQWDQQVTTNLHYYGPFPDDPRKRLGLKYP